MIDPISMMIAKFVVSAALQAAAGNGQGQAGQPLQPSAPHIEATSLGDVSEAILKCYHPTGRFRTASVQEVPWSQSAIYNTAHSVLLRIEWSGEITRSPYQMLIGVMERDNKLKAIIQSDNARVGANAKCALKEWVPVEASP